MRNLASSCTAFRLFIREASNSYKAIASFLAACCLFIASVSFSRAFLRSLYWDTAILFRAVFSSNSLRDVSRALACSVSQNLTAAIAVTIPNNITPKGPIKASNTISAPLSSHVAPAAAISDKASACLDVTRPQVASWSNISEPVNTLWAILSSHVAASAACIAPSTAHTAIVKGGNTSLALSNPSLKPYIILVALSSLVFIFPTASAYNWVFSVSWFFVTLSAADVIKSFCMFFVLSCIFSAKSIPDTIFLWSPVKPTNTRATLNLLSISGAKAPYLDCTVPNILAI